MADIDWLGMAQKLGIAIVIVLVTWLVALLVKWAISKLVTKVPILQREGADGQAVGQSIGTVGSLLVWLFGLVGVLQVFTLESVLSPIQGLLQTIMEYLPNVIGAIFVFFIGFVIARIAKQLIEAAVGMINFGALTAKVKGADPTRSGAPAAPAADATTAGEGAPAPGTAPAPAESARVASVLANITFGVILIFVTIAALQVLGISAISNPAEQMLTLLLGAIPAIIAAVLILGIGYLIAKVVGTILESTLRGFGTDKAIAGLGITTAGTPPSVILTRIAQVAVMVFFAIMAAQALDFPQVSLILNEVLALGGRVLFGGAIIAAGFLVAKILASTVGGGTATTVVRYATIVLFAAMGLKFMGIADSIITLAFGSLVVGGALAAALAFGLGGRDAAARKLARVEANREGEGPVS
ncbi:MAG TPA: mechanosensitive ion channel [Beutenbergiaceae bacterium]|nr:mechanosensitive ion channel [Beutenbergiaceae bacterium]